MGKTKTNMASNATTNLRQLNKQQTALSKVISADGNENPFQNGSLELNHENYTAYVFMLLFKAHYLPWLKSCYGVSYKEEFKNRLNHFNQSLASAIDDFYFYKGSIEKMAKMNAFHLRRKLKISLEKEMHSSGNDNMLRNATKFLRVFVRTTSFASDGQESSFQDCVRIQLDGSSSSSLDIPVSTTCPVFLKFSDILI